MFYLLEKHNLKEKKITQNITNWFLNLLSFFLDEYTPIQENTL